MISKILLTSFLAVAGFTLFAKPTYAQQRLRALSVEETGDLEFAVGEPMSFATSSSIEGAQKLPELVAHAKSYKSTKTAKLDAVSEKKDEPAANSDGGLGTTIPTDPAIPDAPKQEQQPTELDTTPATTAKPLSDSDVFAKFEGTAKSAKAESAKADSADPPAWGEPPAGQNSDESADNWDGYWGGWGGSDTTTTPHPWSTNPATTSSWSKSSKSKSSKSWDCGWSDDGWNGHGGSQLADIIWSIIHHFLGFKDPHGKSGKSGGKSGKSGGNGMTLATMEAEQKMYELLLLLPQVTETPESLAETAGPSVGAILSWLKDATIDGETGDLSKIVAAVLGSVAAGTQDVVIPAESEVPEIVAAGFDSAAAGTQGLDIPADVAVATAVLDSAAAGTQGLDIPADVAAAAAAFGSSVAAGTQGVDVPTYITAAVAAAAASMEDIGVPNYFVAVALEGADAAIGGLPADVDVAFDSALSMP